MADVPDIVVRIPVELTRSMIIRAGVIADEARALELATEVHEVVAACAALYAASEFRVIEDLDEVFLPECDKRPKRKPNALETADFTLAVWRQTLVNSSGQNDDTPDAAEAEWISELLAGLCDHDLYLRWIRLGDVITECSAMSSPAAPSRPCSGMEPPSTDGR
jgi:hypothetical protein